MSNYVLCYCKALNNNGIKWVLLDVNPETRFLVVQKILKAPPKKKHLLDLIVIKNILWIISANWCSQTKSCIREATHLSTDADSRLLMNRGPDQSGSCLILIRQQPDRSGSCLIWSGSNLTNQAAALFWSGSCLTDQAAAWFLYFLIFSRLTCRNPAN